MYKAGMFISDYLTPTALFYCCSPDLHTDTMRDLQDDVSAMKEEDFMAAIRRLAVQDESTLVHRIRLSKMT